MKFTAKQIAEVLQGNVDGNPEDEVFKLAKIEEGEKGALSFLSNPKYEKYIYETKASIVIVNNDFKPEQEILATLIRVPDAYAAFAQLLEMYNEHQLNKLGISEKCEVESSASIGDNAYIGAFAYIGQRVKIGNNVKIYPQAYIGDDVTIHDNTTVFAGVKVYHQCQIGSNCTLHAGCVIGADGFGFAPTENNNYNKVAQIGNVILEDNVEIGTNTTIDRATLGSTIIRKGVKLDNLIQIAHNVEIGDNTVVAAQAGISGSTKVGKNAIIAGQVGLVGHIKIADKTIIAAQSGVTSDITKEGSVILGSPALDIKRYKKSYIHFRNLDKIVKRLDELEKQIKENKE
ncbi:MAG: UDP-3-O-(3-hydroxymyristoyl)glucosamine N-acyltransferase [Hyphomicrobiales bacterium]